MMSGREEEENRMKVKHVYQIKLGVRQRDPAGKGVRAG